MSCQSGSRLVSAFPSLWQLTAPPSAAGRLPAPPASRWVWALQQARLCPSTCLGEKCVLTQRESLFLPSLSISLCVFPFFSFLPFFSFSFFFYLIIFLILDEVAGFCSTSLHEQTAPLRDFTAFKGHRTATMVKCLV